MEKACAIGNVKSFNNNHGQLHFYFYHYNSVSNVHIAIILYPVGNWQAVQLSSRSASNPTTFHTNYCFELAEDSNIHTRGALLNTDFMCKVFSNLFCCSHCRDWNVIFGQQLPKAYSPSVHRTTDQIERQT